MFPNYLAMRAGTSVRLELSHAQLFDPLTETWPSITVAAELDETGRPGAYREVTNPRLRFFSLGTRKRSYRGVRKLIEYIGMVVPVYRAVSQNEFCYIFAPGNVGLIAWFICALLRRRYALYLRGDWRTGTPKLFHPLQSVVLRNAAFVMCTGNSLADKTRYTNKACEAVVPMSEVLMTSAYRRSEASEHSGLRLLFIGQLVREKGVFELLEAFSIIQSDGFSDSMLTIVGAGEARAEIEARIQTLGLSANVKMTGLVDNTLSLADIYGTHDVFCLPTYHEGFPRVLYEAMWFGLPIIATPVGQIGSVVADRVNGLLVPPRNARALALAIHELFSDMELRKRLSAAGQAAIEPMMSRWKKTTHGYQVLAWLSKKSPVDQPESLRGAP